MTLNWTPIYTSACPFYLEECPDVGTLFVT